MWATLRTFEHNNLDGMTLIPAPKYGHAMLWAWAQKHRSVITLLKIGARKLRVTYFEPMGVHGFRIRAVRFPRCLHQTCKFQTTAPALPRE